MRYSRRTSNYLKRISLSDPTHIMSMVDLDRYYVVYKPITLPCISFMFIEMKFIHCHSNVTFAMKSMNIYND